MIKWWVVWVAVGAAFLPLTVWMFGRFRDKGYIFSRAMALLLLCFVMWMLSSLSILSYSGSSVWLALLVLALCNAGLAWYKRGYFLSTLQNFRHIIKPALVTEGMFLTGLLFWCYIRGHQPNLHELEKFMDYGFIMSILRTEHMPPLDMWFSGHTINYYYFGHLICATFIRLSGIAPEYAYNLWIATLFSVSLTFTFSITYNICHRVMPRHAWKAGVVSGLMMAFASNMQTFMEGIVAPALGRAISTYQYFDATRYVGYDGSFLSQMVPNDKTIHEFPSYSSIVADLHAHFIAIFITLTIIALLFAMVMRLLDHLDEYEWNRVPREIPQITVLLAMTYISNAWDFPIYSMMLGMCLLFVNYRKYGWKVKTLYSSVIVAVLSAVTAFLLDLPFHIGFKNIASEGIRSGLLRTLTENGREVWRPAITMPDKFLFLYGHFLFMGVLLIWLLHTIHIKNAYARKKGKGRSAARSNIRFLDKVKKLAGSVDIPDMLVVILFVGGVILLILPEVVYVVDIYEAGFPRANTMFKLTYNGYMMFTVTMGYIWFSVYDHIRLIRRKGLIFTLTTLFVILPLLYPLPKPLGGGAIDGFYSVTTGGSYKTINCLEYLNDNGLVAFGEGGRILNTQDDYAAIKWLLANVQGQPVVLEAGTAGTSHTYINRISAITGLPTVVGWETHQWLWRGDKDGSGFNERVQEVRTIYETDSMDLTKDLLAKYDVAYLVVGTVEREKYADINTKKLLNDLGPVVFDAPETKIVKIQF